jgi:HAD superfamily hydrolase (TIGR01509 family)
MAFSAIFFDLDETLITCMDAHRAASRQVFLNHGIDFQKTREKVPNVDFLGMRMIEILKILRDAAGKTEAELPIAQLAAERDAIFVELVPQNPMIMPGAKAAVQLCKGSGLITALVSSGSKNYINVAIELIGVSGLFDFIVSGDDIMAGKPAPDCYLKAWEIANTNKPTSKQTCLVVEDSTNGVKAAIAAGLKSLLIPYLPSKEPVTADYELKSLLEFAKVLA